MPAPRVMILRSAGTNCDIETEHAWRLAGADPRRVHIRRLIESPTILLDYQILTIPGGFSYGDDIAAGAIMAAQIARRVSDAIGAFVSRGGFVLGICNGFQVLVKAGLLPTRVRPFQRTCTVTYNDPPGFQDRWVALRGATDRCVFVENNCIYEMPIAHGEGRVMFRDPAQAAQLLDSGQAAFLYAPPADLPLCSTTLYAEHSPDGAAGRASNPPSVEQGSNSFAPQSTPPTPPFNPNGSAADIAGLCDDTGRVMGLMPHPDRFVEWVQHPRHTSLAARNYGDGLAIFQKAVRLLT